MGEFTEISYLLVWIWYALQLLNLISFIFKNQLMLLSVTCLFDLYPLNQEILEGVTDIDLVINLRLREDALLAKCLGRRICSHCGGNFNVAAIDFKGENGRPGICMPPLLPPPQCASKLITRSDDTEEVIKERLRVYHDQVYVYLFVCRIVCYCLVLSPKMQIINWYKASVIISCVLWN